MFEISHLQQKLVHNTEFYPIDKDEDVYIVEYPHLNSRNLSKELANNCNMQYVLNTCQDYRVILLLNGPDLCIERGAPMIEFLTRFMRTTSKSLLFVNSFDEYVKPVVVRHEVFINRKEFERQFQKIIEIYD